MRRGHPEVELAVDAENDIRQIARYTFRTWGAPQARRYQAAFTRTFEATYIPLKK